MSKIIKIILLVSSVLIAGTFLVANLFYTGNDFELKADTQKTDEAVSVTIVSSDTDSELTREISSLDNSICVEDGIETDCILEEPIVEEEIEDDEEEIEVVIENEIENNDEVIIIN